MKKMVYISGPIYSSGVASKNMRRAINVANNLINAGFCVYVPHLSVLWDAMTPQPREFWMKLDKDIVEHCQILLRLDGYSEGAEDEIAHADNFKGREIKLYNNIDTLIAQENPEMPEGGAKYERS